jgi:putative modified peptide
MFSRGEFMSAALPQDVANTLLDKLSSDDSFRALFQTDPETALKQIGLPDPKTYCACKPSASLPSKQVIQQTRGTLHAQLTSTSGMLVFSA